MPLKLKDVHIGQLVEQKLREANISKQEFAEKLGIPQQNAHRIFKKSSIDTDKLAKICQILDYNFFDEFTEHHDSPILGSQFGKLVRQHKDLLEETRVLKAKKEKLEKDVEPDVLLRNVVKMLNMVRHRDPDTPASPEEEAKMEQIGNELAKWNNLNNPELDEWFDTSFEYDKKMEELEKLTLVLEKYYELDELVREE